MKRMILAILLAGVLAARPAFAAEPSTLKIGYQKNGALVILKQQHSLEVALQAEGVSVQWVEFQSGPPLMEALNAGGIDVGATGDTPPVFAQAGGVDLLYIAYLPVTGRSAGIVVAKDSPIHSIADLKGHTVAFTKGSSAHYQTVQTLATVGLEMADVTPVYLQPAEAAAAFRTGRVDAWTIWDPFFAIVERDAHARVLTTGEVAPSNSFILARRPYADAHDGVITKLVAEINKAAEWSGAHQDQLAKIMNEITGVDLETQRIAAERGTYSAAFLTPEVIARQQHVADTLLGLKIIPRPIDIAAAVFYPRTNRAELQVTKP